MTGHTRRTRVSRPRTGVSEVPQRTWVTIPVVVQTGFPPSTDTGLAPPQDYVDPSVRAHVRHVQETERRTPRPLRGLGPPVQSERFLSSPGSGPQGFYLVVGRYVRFGDHLYDVFYTTLKILMVSHTLLL